MAALVVAVLAMAFAVPAAFAAGPLTSDGTVTISGIDQGDKVTLYKIIKWDNGWVLNGSFGELTVDNLTNNTGNTDGITIDEAATIASNVADGMIVKIGEVSQKDIAVGASGEYTATVDPGMYLALITDVNNDTVYNPVFVSSDWDQENQTNVIDASEATLIGGEESIAKKEDLELNKDIDTSVTASDNDGDKKSVAPGDIVPFKVTVPVPTYAENYTNPTFSISDTLQGAITMSSEQQAAIAVSVAGMPGLVKRASAEQTTYDYEITNVTGKGYTVSFSKQFLQSVHGNPLVTITYQATVDALAEGATLKDVERYRNEATLTFSNDPTNVDNHGTRDDETNHYTFSLDAGLNGANAGSKVTKELVKVGVDAEGNTVTAWTTSDEEKWEAITPLQGAVFKLVSSTTNKEYTATSDADGFLHFYGLDAGDYTLTEETAPAGYVKDGTTHTVKITPTFTEVTDDTDGTKHQVLASYTVTVDGTNNSTYTVTNNAESEAITEVVENDANITTPFTNVKGTTLPSTGGIGTTILYVVGGIMVLLAAVWLITKRRMSKTEIEEEK